MIIPAKFSRTWLWVFVIYLLGLFNLFIVSQILLKAELSAESLPGYLLLAAASAVIAAAGGYLGGRVFFVVYSICIALGALYMICIIAFDLSPGWGDLTSLMSYLFFAVIGLLAGIITQIAFLAKGRDRKKEVTEK